MSERENKLNQMLLKFVFHTEPEKTTIKQNKKKLL